MMAIFIRTAKRSISALFLGALLAGCAGEDIAGPSVPEQNGGMTFVLDLPEANVVETRAGEGSESENRIDRLWLLAFNEAGTKLMYKEQFTASDGDFTLSGTNNNNVLFTTSPSHLTTGITYRFVLLANIAALPDGVAALSPGDDYSTADLAESLTAEYSSKWSVGGTPGPIPMWGEITTEIYYGVRTHLIMGRMLARIDVSSNAANFRIRSVYLYNYNTRGYVIPASTTWYYVTDVTNYAGGNYLKPTKGPLDYTAGVASDGKSCAPIYTFEAAKTGTFPAHSLAQGWDDWNDSEKRKWQNNPCLVVGGQYYNGSSWEAESFYRLDFIEKDWNGTDKKWHDLLRNHLYNVKIQSVNGTGYADAETALVSAPVNIDASAYPISLSETESAAWDGPYYLIADQPAVEYNWWESTQMQLGVKTNYPGGWSASVKDPDNKKWLRINSTLTSFSSASRESVLPLHFPGINYREYEERETCGQFEWTEIDGELWEVGEIVLTAGRMSLTIPVRRRSITDLYAKSNVAVNGPNRLGFAVTRADHATFPANMQGLHFKWGSLIGVSSDSRLGYTGGLSADIYVWFCPPMYEMPAEGYSQTNYADIPYEDSPIDIPDPARRGYDQFIHMYEGTGYDAAQGKGDICRYISDQRWVSGRWRMPVTDEHIALFMETAARSDDSRDFIGKLQGPFEDVGFPETDGTVRINTGAWFGAHVTDTSFDNMASPREHTLFYPASGYRSLGWIKGALHSVGYTGKYWSSCGNASGQYYSGSGSPLTFGSEFYLSTANTSESLNTMFAIRCIRDYNNE